MESSGAVFPVTVATALGIRQWLEDAVVVTDGNGDCCQTGGVMNTQKGFTLIEVMIVVAIISILAAVAVAVFPLYIAKTQVTAALADMHPGKTLVEAVIVESQSATAVTPEYLGLSRSVHCSSVAAELADSGVGSITCTVKGNSTVDGKDLVLRRSAEGIWSCDGSAFEARVRPAGC